MPRMKKQLYVLLHTFKEGAAVNLFSYSPTKKYPYPDANKAAELLGLELDCPGQEQLELILVDTAELDMEFTADEIGRETPEEIVEFLEPATSS